MNTIRTLFIVASITASAFAAAESSDLDPQWRLLGPAAAFHHGDHGSYITQPTAGVWSCKTEYGYSCVGVDTPAQRGWQERNPAIGIEYSRLSSPGSISRDRFFASLVTDSYNKMSLMTGVGRGWSIGHISSIKFEAGVVGGLWYRTVAGDDVISGKISYCFSNGLYFQNQCVQSDKDYYLTELKRTFVPFVLPFLSVTETNTGLGFNLALAPKIRIGSNYMNQTTTLMLQTTLQFK